MKKNKGQNIVEFIIIVALIAVVCIFSLSILGGSTLNIFNSSSNRVENFDPFGKNSPVKAQNPYNNIFNGIATYNSDGTMNITVDGITISNIPGDFYNTLQATGSSGGTKLLADVISQMATFLETQGNTPTEQVQVLLNLASKANDMAAIEKQIEDIAKGIVEFCSTQPNGQDCSYTGYYDAGGSSYVSELTGLDGNSGLNQEFYQLLKSNDFKAFKDAYPQSSILVQVLADEIHSLAQYIAINNISLGDNGYQEEGKVRIYNAQDILTPGFESPSKITDIDASIICNIGNGSYNPNGCN